MSAALERLIRWAARETPYMKCYPAVVQRALTDGGVELLADDEGMRAFGAVAVPRPGLPNSTITPAIGQRCLLAFEAADPSRPYVAAWEGGTKGNRVGLNGGKRRVARMCDPVEACVPPPGVPLPVQGTITGTMMVPGTPPTPVPIPPGTPFSGTITLLEAPVGMVMGGNPKLLG